MAGAGTGGGSSRPSCTSDRTSADVSSRRGCRGIRSGIGLLRVLAAGFKSSGERGGQTSASVVPAAAAGVAAGVVGGSVRVRGALVGDAAVLERPAARGGSGRAALAWWALLALGSCRPRAALGARWPGGSGRAGGARLPGCTGGARLAGLTRGAGAVLARRS